MEENTQTPIVAPIVQPQVEYTQEQPMSAFVVLLVFLAFFAFMGFVFLSGTWYAGSHQEQCPVKMIKPY